jgi:DmsE family decaheme c-type cytochrome
LRQDLVVSGFEGVGMTVKRVAAVIGFCLFGLLGHSWAAEPTGAAFCVTCHDSDDLTDMSRSAHGFVADKRTPDCISCHGPSTEHAYDPNKAAVTPKPDVTFGKKFGKNNAVAVADRNNRCLTCHDKDAKRALWAGSQHQYADMACDSCHVVHANKDKALNRRTQADTCYSCHKEQRNQLNKESHHPVPEGKMTCSDCHNVHGSAGPKLVKRDSINDTCYTCHAEKRGPFIHQHDPVAEDCSNCHVSHGSANVGMLKVRAPLLCQQCHTSHPASSVASLGASANSSGVSAISTWQGRSCMNCHTQVHGSNNPSVTNSATRSFMR